jgi:hypothetical protein
LAKSFHSTDRLAGGADDGGHGTVPLRERIPVTINAYVVDEVLLLRQPDRHDASGSIRSRRDRDWLQS